MVTMLNPGSYYLEAIVYNTYPACLGYCAPSTAEPKIIAKDSSDRKIIIDPVGTAKSYVSVLSPNGGETWSSGSIQTIKWKDSTPMPKCPDAAMCINPAPKFYDIKLESTSKRPCSGNICADVLDSYTIAKNVADTFYQWIIGKTLDLNEALIDGAYTVQICQSGTSSCDSSDSYFKIAPSEQVIQPVVKTTVTAVIDGVVSESVKCIFEGSTSSQTCYSTNKAGKMFIFNGTETAGGTISGTKNENLTWKSSCGGYAYTVITGDNKYAKFSCKPYSI